MDCTELFLPIGEEYQTEIYISHKAIINNRPHVCLNASKYNVPQKL